MGLGGLASPKRKFYLRPWPLLCMSIRRVGGEREDQEEDDCFDDKQNDEEDEQYAVDDGCRQLPVLPNLVLAADRRLVVSPRPSVVVHLEQQFRQQLVGGAHLRRVVLGLRRLLDAVRLNRIAGRRVRRQLEAQQVRQSATHERLRLKIQDRDNASSSV